MKKAAGIFAALVLVWTAAVPVRGQCAEEPDISAKAAVVISADTGEIIYSLEPYKKLPMASTTKIMTALLCLESGGLYDEFTVDSEAIKVEGSSMGLREGDTVTKYALCCGMLLPSGNDAANAAAVRIAGSIEAFAGLMNERAREMGLSRTYFVTPSGLEGEGHGSSAYDMALLAREALRNEQFRDICSRESISVSFGSPPYERKLMNTNKLLTMCDGVYGVKTGFTDEAGRCLVSACQRDGRDLICVTLNDRSDWQDHISLYDYGFGCVRTVDVQLPGDISADIVGGTRDEIRLVPEKSSVSVTAFDKNGKFDLTVLRPTFFYAPLNEGDQAGELRISFGGREVCTVPLYAAESVGAFRPKKKKTIARRIKNIFGRLFSR